MKYKNIIIEKSEYYKLKSAMSTIQPPQEPTSIFAWETFSREMDSARLVAFEQMPSDVIRFNSMVRIETPWNVKRSYQIVSPEENDLRNNRISVLAPMSLALFGYAEGDEFEWSFPIGIKNIRILEVINYHSQLKANAV